MFTVLFLIPPLILGVFNNILLLSYKLIEILKLKLDEASDLWSAETFNIFINREVTFSRTLISMKLPPLLYQPPPPPPTPRRPQIANNALNDRRLDLLCILAKYVPTNWLMYIVQTIVNVNWKCPRFDSSPATATPSETRTRTRLHISLWLSTAIDAP